MKNILTIVILLNLIICGILIGAPIESTHIPMIITSLVLCALYIILSKSKIKIIRNKVDIFIVLLGISTLIPLVFNTAVSITSEINYIFKYISAILMYICVREHITNYPETRKLIVNCIIFSSLILIILGIDNITTKVFTDPLSLINIKIEEIEKNRLSSVFCYSNALAIVIAISIILNNMNYLQEEHKIKKSIYSAITTILMMGLILTYSRLVMLFLAISLIIYCILLRNKIKVYDLIKLFLISTVISCVYSTVFFKIVNNEKYILIWFATVIASLISFILTYCSIGIEKKLEKIKIKKIVIVALLLLSIIVILVFSIKGKLDVFKNSRNEYEIQLGNIKPNTEYTLKFDFEEVVINKNEKNLKIELIEMNEFTDKMVIAEIDEKEFLETGQIKVTTKDTTTMMKIVFSRISNNCKIIINKFTINGQNRVLDYKLIPDDIEDRINNTFMTQKGFYERKSFIEDGIKLIKDNLLFGKGGNAWEYEQYNYQQYYYMATQVHSYIIQLGIEYGILAMISYLAVIVLIIYRYIKSKNKYDIQQISIIISILLLIGHSLIDFEMTYLYILQSFFILLAMLFSFDAKSVKGEKKIKNFIFSAIIFILLLGYTVLRPYYDSNIKIDQIETLSKECYKKNHKDVELENKLIKKYEEYFKLERHYIVNTNYYFNYARVVQRNMNDTNVNNMIEKLQFVYDIAKRANPSYELDRTLLKYDGCKLIADKIRLSKTSNSKLKELEKNFYELVLEKSKETKDKLENEYNLYRITKEKQEQRLGGLEDLYNKTLEDFEKDFKM